MYFHIILQSIALLLCIMHDGWIFGVLLVGASANNSMDEEAEEWHATLAKRVLASQDRQGNHGSKSGLIWTNLSVQTHRHHNKTRVLVQPFSGHLVGGEICGLMGPSGAGKSSYLSALVGTQALPTTGHVQQYHFQSNHNSTAEPLLILQDIHPNQVAWLQQQDSFFEMLTVHETLQLAAWLELPHVAHGQRQQLIQQTIDALGLQSARHSKIGTYVQRLGNPSSRLSGGERRRLSVALELLTEKQFLVADEPITGLDATMSSRVMNLIRETIQHLDIPALCVLHQPRSSVWHGLDSVILMAEGGRVCYAGKRANAVDYFAKLGFQCPDATNPAEYFVDLISIDPEDPVKAAKDEERVSFLAQEFRRWQANQVETSDKMSTEIQIVVVNSHQEKDGAIARSSMPAKSSVPSSPTPSRYLRLTNTLQRIPRRLGSLLRRSWRQNYRNSVTNMARLVMSIVNALLMTQLFPTVRGSVPTANSMADRAALLTTASVIVINMAFMKAADLFEKEYPVVRREQMRHQYSSLEYLVAKVLAEIPLDCFFAGVFSTVLKYFSGIRIGWGMLTATYSFLTAAGASLGFLLGGIFAQDGLAVNAGLPLLVILMVVGVINPSGVDPSRPPPVTIHFLKKFSPFAYAINALMIGEYKDMQFQSNSGSNNLLARLRELPRLGAMAMVQNGNQVLEALGLKDETYAGSMRRLAALTVGNLFFSWIGLSWQQRRRSPRRKKHYLDDEVAVGKSNTPVIRRVRI